MQKWPQLNRIHVNAIQDIANVNVKKHDKYFKKK